MVVVGSTRIVDVPTILVVGPIVVVGSIFVEQETLVVGPIIVGVQERLVFGPIIDFGAIIT